MTNPSPSEAELRTEIRNIMYPDRAFSELAPGADTIVDKITALFTHYSKQQVLAARIEELEGFDNRILHQLTKLDVFDKEKLEPSSDTRWYARYAADDRIAELRNLQEGGEG